MAINLFFMSIQFFLSINLSKRAKPSILRVVSNLILAGLCLTATTTATLASEEPTLEELKTLRKEQLNQQVDQTVVKKKTNAKVDGQNHKGVPRKSGHSQTRISEPTETAPQTHEAERQHKKGSIHSDADSKRFEIEECGSIFDKQTGLEWFVGPDYNMDWFQAKTWVKSLSVCGSKSWKMPGINELKTLFDKRFTAGSGYYTGGQYWPAHISGEFSQIGGGSWVWTSQTVGSGSAKSFNFNQGFSTTSPKQNTSYSTRAFAVR